jgi:hypothetical protein
MLRLDSSRWSELTHAYGSAGDIPALLHQLKASPATSVDAEPWDSLWSALAHQGEVYSASFAAVPHVIEILSIAPKQAGASFFQFPAWVEICRHRSGIAVPQDLRDDYIASLQRLPQLVGAVADRVWDDNFLVSVLAAVAAAKSAPDVASTVLELTTDVVADFDYWLHSR